MQIYIIKRYKTTTFLMHFQNKILILFWILYLNINIQIWNLQIWRNKINIKNLNKRKSYTKKILLYNDKSYIDFNGCFIKGANFYFCPRFLNLTIVKNVSLIFMHETCQKCIKEKKKSTINKCFFSSVFIFIWFYIVLLIIPKKIIHK